MQKKTGEVKELVDREYKGVKYVRRVESASTSYYLLRGSVLVYSGQESCLQQAVDCDRTLAVDAKPPLARRLEDLGLDRALLALTLNPRVLDDAVVGKVSGDSATKLVAACWKALQGVGLGVHLDRDLRISLTIKARTDQLPAPARRFLASAGRASEVWPAFPDHALFAVAGRLDVSALYDLLGELLSRPGKEAMQTGLERSLGAMLGMDVIKDVLPALGPDWGLCVTAPPAGSKHWRPHLLFALRVSPGEGNDRVDEALLGGLQSSAQLLVLGHNKQYPEQPISLRSTTLDKVKVRHVQGDRTFPPGIQPAFALKAGYLVLASAPEEVRRFKVGPGIADGAGVPLDAPVAETPARLSERPARRPRRGAGAEGQHHPGKGPREARRSAHQSGGDRSHRADAEDRARPAHAYPDGAAGATAEEIGRAPGRESAGEGIHRPMGPLGLIRPILPWPLSPWAVPGTPLAPDHPIRNPLGAD